MNKILQILSAKGHEGTSVNEFSRPSGLCCDDDGHVIVADSKNQRVLIFSPQLDYLGTVSVYFVFFFWFCIEFYTFK